MSSVFSILLNKKAAPQSLFFVLLLLSSYLNDIGLRRRVFPTMFPDSRRKSSCQAIYDAVKGETVQVTEVIENQIEMEVFTALIVIHREGMAGFEIPSSLEDLIPEILGTLAVVLEDIIIA